MSIEKKTQKKVGNESTTAHGLADLINDEGFVREIEESPFFRNKYQRAVEIAEKINWSKVTLKEKQE
ncbi:hypothetical protein [Dyadobacter sp. 676]|uniref:Uncharacterized protein n=1 Tax=Dyadobacter sp. 676 TaxID=3088362 RepID=A0AAU8FEM3_9BACT